MYERKASPVGTFHEIDIDTNNDKVADYAIFNRDVSGNTTLTVTGAKLVGRAAGDTVSPSALTPPP